MSSVKQFFYSHPVFRYETFALFMKERGTLSPNSRRQRLQYHINAGHIVTIKRELYAVLNPISDTTTEFYVDPFLIAGEATEDAVLAYHTALELHGIAYTTFETLTFITRKRIRAFNFQSQIYQPVSPPSMLLKRGRKDFGVETITRSGLELKVISLERSIVDVIDRPTLSGGWEEIWRSLEHLVTFDINKLIEYLLLLNKASTIGKVGFFLEKLTTVHGIDKEALNELVKYAPKQPCYLERGKREQGTLIKKWNIVVPDSILKQTWEEDYEANIC